MSEWTEQLQQASFRGVPFAVMGSSGRHGRKVAAHQYPFRDVPWVEDLGRGMRRIQLVGFLITDSAIYGGGDVIAQRERLIAACEAKDKGTLVHPTLGQLQVSIPAEGFEWQERWDQGRYFEIVLTCLESGERSFPAGSAATTTETSEAADAGDAAALDDYASELAGSSAPTNALAGAPPLSIGSGVTNMVERTASSFAGSVIRAASDATSLFNSLVRLPGNYGRYFPGATQGFATGRLPVSTATIGSLTTDGIMGRLAVSTACTALTRAAGLTDPRATGNAALGVTAALLAATANPADAVRVMSGVVNFYPARPTSGSVIGLAEAMVQTATGAMCRRAVLGSLARASATYQPSSADDAAGLRSRLADLFSREILVAGDSGADASFLALRNTRAAIIRDLDTRGAALPSLATIVSNEPMPAPVVAQRQYRAASRADELVVQANPVHPAFMPAAFRALGV